MGLTIRQKADRIGGFRFVSVQLMETLAAWVPATAELEAKVLFGRHVWDFAQHADQLGRRTGELRAPLQYSHPPTDGYRRALDVLTNAPRTADRVAGLYDVMLPDLERRYGAHLSRIDRLDDEPSLRIIERILHDFPRFRADRAAFGQERPDLAPPDAAWVARLAALASAEAEMVGERPPTRAAARTA